MTSELYSSFTLGFDAVPARARIEPIGPGAWRIIFDDELPKLEIIDAELVFES